MPYIAYVHLEASMRTLKVSPSTGNEQKKVSFVLKNEVGSVVGDLRSPSLTGEKVWEYTVQTSHSLTGGTESTMDKARDQASRVYNQIITIN